MAENIGSRPHRRFNKNFGVPVTVLGLAAGTLAIALFSPGTNKQSREAAIISGNLYAYVDCPPRTYATAVDDVPATRSTPPSIAFSCVDTGPSRSFHRPQDAGISTYAPPQGIVPRETDFWIGYQQTFSPADPEGSVVDAHMNRPLGHTPFAILTMSGADSMSWTQLPPTGEAVA